MSDIDVLEQSGKRLNDPDKLMRDLFIEKITKDDSSIQQYTGFPSKNIFAGAFGKHSIIEYILEISNAKFVANNIFFPLNL